MEGVGWGANKYHSFSDISQNNDTCVSVVPVIVVISGLAYFQWYLRAHLQCFVYLCVEISGSRILKKRPTYYHEVNLKQNTQENKTNKKKKTMNEPSPLPTSCKKHLPSRAAFSLLGSYRCEKLEAWSLLRAPAPHHCNSSNTPVVDVGLTAKFVLRYPDSFSFTSPTGNLGRSRGTGGENRSWEEERKRRRGSGVQPRDFLEVCLG